MAGIADAISSLVRLERVPILRSACAICRGRALGTLLQRSLAMTGLAFLRPP